MPSPALQLPQFKGHGAVAWSARVAQPDVHPGLEEGSNSIG